MNGSHPTFEDRLAAVDFSDESARRHELRRELLARLANGAGAARPTARPRGGLSVFGRPAPAFGAGAAAAALLLALLHPDGRAALARLPGLLHIAPHTAIDTDKVIADAQLDSVLAALDRQVESGEVVLQITPYGGGGGVVPPGGDPYIKEASSLRVAAGLVRYPLLVPTWFDERIPARNRFQKAEIMPDGNATLYFGRGSLETALTLVPIGDGREVTHSSSVVTIAGDGTMTQTMLEPELEELQVAGRAVVWQKHAPGTRRNLGGRAVRDTLTEIGCFLWEQDGLSCRLDGRFLTRETGARIIGSLRTYDGRR